MKKNNAFVFLHLSVLLFGFTAILGKLISLNHLGLVWNRMWIALPLFIFIPGFIKKLLSTNLIRITTFLAIGSIVALHWITFYGSIKIGNSASLTLACLGTASFFTSLFEPWVLKTKFNSIDIFFGLCSVIGITFIAFSQREFDPNATPQQFQLAIIWGIVSSILATIFSVLNAKYAKMESPLVMTFSEMLGGFLFLSMIAFWISGEPELIKMMQLRAVELSVPAADWKWMLALGILCTTVAFVLNVTAMKTVSAFTANIAINLEPVYGIVLAFFIFDEAESFNALFYLGTLIILATVFTQGAFAVRRRKRMESKSTVLS